MKIAAKLRHLRMSPRKVRLVADLVRGMDIVQAKNQLKFMPKRSAGYVLKLLESAIANAKNNFGIQNQDNLFISEIKVDQGPSLKRWRARAMGRAARILKRTSHISLILSGKNAITETSKKDKAQKTNKHEKGAGIVSAEPSKKAGKHVLPSSRKSGKSMRLKEPDQKLQKPDLRKKREEFSKQAGARKFSRLGNKIFRRKSI